MSRNISALKADLASIKTGYILLLGGLMYLSVLFLNDGFMALDEYWVGITRYIPAQASSAMTLVGPDDVKSPLQLLPMHGVAQAAYALGVDAPYWQYRAVIFVLGLFSVGLLFFAFLKFAASAGKSGGPAGLTSLDRSATNFLLLLLTFYFAAPFCLTRPMFESVAAPWLALAGVWAYRYDHAGRLKDLLWGVFFGSVAFVLRQQLGFCALVFLILPVLKKNGRHLFWAAALGLGFFVLSGIPDYFMRGQFHFSLLHLTVYNYEHGAEYGNQSVLFYPAVIFVIAFVPFLLARYPAGFVRAQLRRDRSLWVMLALFVFLHSLFPQKWERFLISVIPLLILLAFPFLYELHRNFRGRRIRLISLYSLNGFLFVVASFFPAQKNLIEMSRYLDAHPGIRKVHRVANTPEWITEAFIRHKNFDFVEDDAASLEKVDWSDCGEALVLGEAQEHLYTDLTARLRLRAEFNVNLIEQLAFKLNPEKNLRRVRLKLYSGCDR